MLRNIGDGSPNVPDSQKTSLSVQFHLNNRSINPASKQVEKPAEFAQLQMQAIFIGCWWMVIIQRHGTWIPKRVLDAGRAIALSLEFSENPRQISQSKEFHNQKKHMLEFHANRQFPNALPVLPQQKRLNRSQQQSHIEVPRGPGSVPQFSRGKSPLSNGRLSIWDARITLLIWRSLACLVAKVRSSKLFSESFFP